MTLGTPEVWFVDDDEDDRLMLRLAFDDITPPASLLTLNNGSQLLAEISLEETIPRLLLLDLNMPGLTGMELVRELRTMHAFATLPIIILTTSNSPVDRQQCMVAGATDFIIKPTSYNQLKVLAQQLSQQWLSAEK